MVVSWNSTTDQILLLKILETSSVNINAEAIAAAWPTDQGSCTPRAIKERIFKIRKATGTVSPRKPRSATKKAGNGVKKTVKVKRNGRGKVLDSEDSETEDTDFGSVKKETYDSDENNDINVEEVISPSQTTKRGAAAAAAKAFTSANPVVVKSEPEDDAFPAGNDGPLDDEAKEMIAEI